MYFYIGQICLFPWSWAPQGWAKCDGSLLDISSNTALFSLLGTEFGGDGQKTFGLPNLSDIKSQSGGDADYYICLNGVYPSRS
jgi:microcystin-dependent protein